MSSIVVKGYISINVKNPIRGYKKTFVITIKILYHKNGHYVRPNMVVFKYLDFEKNVDLDVDVIKCSIL